MGSALGRLLLRRRNSFIFLFGLITPPLALSSVFAFKYFIARQPSPPAVTKKVLVPLDSLNRLQHEQQREALFRWLSAKKNLRLRDYSGAKADLKKLHALLPRGYNGSLGLAIQTEALMRARKPAAEDLTGAEE